MASERIDRGAHGRPGRDAVVDENDTPLCDVEGRAAAAVDALATCELDPFRSCDTLDRVVVDRDREMLRIDETMQETVACLLRASDRGPVEVVVRFGAPAVEIEREVEAFDADTVALAPGAALRARWRAWRLRRRLAVRPHIRLLVVEGGARPRPTAEVVMRPA